jgi:hypothetical protein
MNKIKKNISLTAVIIIYLLFNFRYSPDNILISIKSTLIQLLMTSPFIVGLTILIVTFIQRSSGKRLPWDRVIRIYCTLGIIIGFFHALSEYWLHAQ